MIFFGTCHSSSRLGCVDESRISCRPTSGRLRDRSACFNFAGCRSSQKRQTCRCHRRRQVKESIGHKRGCGDRINCKSYDLVVVSKNSSQKLKTKRLKIAVLHEALVLLLCARFLSRKCVKRRRQLCSQLPVCSCWTALTGRRG